MEFFSTICAVLLFTMACNLDTILLSMGYAVKGIHIARGSMWIIAVVTTAVTWLSLWLGDVVAALFSTGTSRLLGGLLLAGIGLWFILDFLRSLGEEKQETATSGFTDFWGCLSLAAALAVNNAGIGVAAGVAGIGLWTATAGNFLVTLFALHLGRFLGLRMAGRFLGRYALPLSGLLLVLLGLWQAMGLE
ncbi:MAG: sporulation protein [Oscillospiraceae bacterium]|nr:sporulation protein [Oscillospiraceae bacterium]